MKSIKFDAKVDKNEKLLVFGTGNYATKFCDYYGEKIVKEEIDYFVVTNKTQNKYYGVEIISFNDVKTSFSDYVIIIAVSKENRKGIEEKIRAIFKRVILLEDFMSMSFFVMDKKDREKEIEKYYQNFQKKIPLFKYIEIETINRCNGSCGFCPVNKNEPQRPLYKMEEEVFKKIVDELSSLNYSGKVALFSNNEPFIDERIIDFAKYSRQKLPNAYIYIASNGLLVTEEKYNDIYPYIDRFVFDIYKDSLKDPDPDNIVKIINYAKENDMIKKMEISRISKSAIRSSRGGKSPNSRVNFTIKDKCPLPLVQIVVRPTGEISLCCNDALGINTIGDVRLQSILEIWESSEYLKIRSEIMKGRENIPLCKYCDYVDMREL